MIPALFGLVSNGQGDWHALGGNGYLRARLYASPFEYVSLTITDDGRFQVVQCRRRRYWSQDDPLNEIVVVRRGRIVRASPSLEFSAWPKQRLAELAGLAPDGERLKLATGEWSGWEV